MSSGRDMRACYETLRAEVLTSAANEATQSFGRALLCSRGMAEWMAAWSAIAPVPTSASRPAHSAAQPTIVQIPVDFKAQLAALLAHTVLEIQKEAALC